MTKLPKSPAPFPTKDRVQAWLAENPGRQTKRDIARAFQIRSADDKLRLKKLLREMAGEGAVETGFRRSVKAPGTLAAVTVLDVVGRDIDGELLARPANWGHEATAPKILVNPGKKPPLIPGVGDRILAHLDKVEDGYEARVIRLLQASPGQVVGQFKLHQGKSLIHPSDRRTRHDYVVDRDDRGGAQDGELVVADVLPAGHMGPKKARVRERLGDLGNPRSISLIAVHTHGIPTEFPAEALREAEAARPVTLAGRTDLRQVPLITIDPPDARDHDDAVWAEETADGWRAIVAIADVAHYVTPGSALDAEALKRGNSCYFPDRVVPMLPEALSADLCSLKPGVDRACLAVELHYDKGGHVTRHNFVRGLMKSAAKLSYQQAQAAIDGRPDDDSGPLLEPVLNPLWDLFRAILRAREKRQPLDLDLPERRITLSPEGHVASIDLRERLDAMRVIEELMIAANVAAAETLELKKQPCMYRVHEPPSLEKMEALRQYLDSIDLRVAKGQHPTPQMFNQILRRVVETPNAQVVNEVILRSQSQAYYGPKNLGHFGLNLRRYAHFTSPIRRYADVLVHRALIRGLGLGSGALSAAEEARFEQIGEDISAHERRAMAAERDSIDRYVAAFMADRVGARFAGRISGVTKFGLFVTLAENGASGLVPVSTLGRDYYVHDEKHQALVGERTGHTYRLGEPVKLRLAEAVPVTGGLRFELLEGGSAGKPVRNARPRRRY